MVQWLELRASTAGGMGLMPGGGIKTPNAMLQKKKKKKKKFLNFIKIKYK